MYRSRKHDVKYKKYRKHNGVECQFCNLNTEEIITEGKYCYVIRNIFPYSMWDHSKVIEHLMLIPKQHTDSIHALKAIERKEIIDFICKYEAKGFDIFARNQGSNLKTVVHQHTHLIKTDGSHMKRLIYLKKPYIQHFK